MYLKMHPYGKSQQSGVLNNFHGSVCLRNVCVNTNIQTYGHKQSHFSTKYNYGAQYHQFNAN